MIITKEKIFRLLNTMKAHLTAVLEDILKKNHMEQFVVAENTENHNTYSVLKGGDLEQFGLVICGHCGMVFGNGSEKMAHEKIHYFI